MSDINLSDMELLRLSDISIASKYGRPDQGNPNMYAKLAALGLTEKKGEGYIITDLGKATLSLNRNRLFGRKSRIKRRKSHEEFEDSEA